MTADRDGKGMDEEGQSATLRRRAERMATLAALARPVQHEINNLLTVVFANLEMLRRSAAEGAPQRQLDRIQEASRRIELSTRAILSLARRPVPGAAEVTLTEAVTALRPLLEVVLQAPKALTVALEPEGWTVRLDRAALDEALLHLALEMAEPARRGGGLTLAVANRPGGEGGEDLAELSLRLPVPASPVLLAALRRLAEEAGGSFAEAEGGTALRLSLPRHAEAGTPPPGA